MFYQAYLRLCAQAGKSPSAVAEEIGLQKSAVTRWKNGGQPTDATVLRVASYFGVAAESLRQPEQPARIPEVGFDDFTYAMYEQTKDLSAENRRTLLEMARFFREQQQEREKRP